MISLKNKNNNYQMKYKFIFNKQIKKMKSIFNEY